MGTMLDFCLLPFTLKFCFAKHLAGNMTQCEVVELSRCRTIYSDGYVASLRKTRAFLNLLGKGQSNSLVLATALKSTNFQPVDCTLERTGC